MEKESTVIALMYDFDKTLCTKDMQEYTFIPNVGMMPADFWRENTALAKAKKMDAILAYMYLMLEKARTAHKSVQRNVFVQMGADLEFYPGVEGWFDRVNALGKALGVRIEHYIISSGLHEIIEGSSIYKAFKEVYACEFLYDANDVACWPKNVVNYTTKTQFLFRINKGVLDISNDRDLNEFTPDNQRRVPFSNMIYIGDGLTDVPCMRLVKLNGGYSVAVYPEGERDQVAQLIRHQRVDFIEPADYTPGSALDTVVRNMIDKMAMDALLRRRTQREMN